MNSDRGGRELTPQHIRNNKGTGDIKSEEGKKSKVRLMNRPQILEVLFKRDCSPSS